MKILIILLSCITSSAFAELPFATNQAEFEKALAVPMERQRKGLGKGIRAIRKDNPKVGALILFDFDSAIIKPESYPLLEEFAKALRGGLSETAIVINGHTDSDGTEVYNLGLSLQRAESVKEFLVTKYDIADKHLTIKAYGESKPIESNATKYGKMKNRRVEFERGN
ncbi:OmpA family protein [Thiotrichales bacterium HSG1]|nr:OmpA family protein [Thiotrichales bacterium HSG1]